VAIVALAFAGATVTAQAQTNATTATAPAPAKAKTKSAKTPYAGTLSAIDATSATVTTTKGDLKLAIDAKTKFAVDKKKAAATDFATGDKVTGSYTTGADGSLTAASIHKKSAK
jgi:Cu/Ag efflux protein CusF